MRAVSLPLCRVLSGRFCPLGMYPAHVINPRNLLPNAGAGICKRCLERRSTKPYNIGQPGW